MFTSSAFNAFAVFSCLFLVICGMGNPAAQASEWESAGAISMSLGGSRKIEFLDWDAPRLSIREGGGSCGSLAYASLEGHYSRKGWALLSGSRILHQVGGRDAFSLEVPLEQGVSTVDVIAIGPDGQAQMQSLKIQFAGFEEFKAASRLERCGIFSSLDVSTVLSAFKLDASDASDGARSSFSTNVNYGLDLRWLGHWGEKWRSVLELGISSAQFNASVGKALDNSKQTLVSLDAEWGRSFFDRGLVSLGFALNENDFIRSVSGTELSLDTQWIPAVVSNLQYDLVRSGPYALRIRAGGGMLLPEAEDLYSVHLGWVYQGSLGVIRSCGKNQISSEFGYRGLSENTSIAWQRMTEISFKVGWIFRLGGDVVRE